MKTGLLLEGGAMRGLYTAGVLDVFMENNIKIDGIIGVSAGALFGMNYKSKQIGRVLRYNKKYAKNRKYMGFYSLLTTGNIMNEDFCFKKIVNELDPIDYETFKKTNRFFPRIYYRKYPKFVRTINDRYKKYNEELEKVLELEKKGIIFVIRPSKLVKIKRIEKNSEKLQEMYDLGKNDTLKLLDKIKKFIY